MRARRKLTPNQIKFFGTKRQKAALRASRTRRRNIARPKHRRRNESVEQGFWRGGTFHPIRASSDYDPGAVGEQHQYSPQKRKAKRSKKGRRNPGGIVEIALNPAPSKRRKTVAKTKKNTRRRSHSSHRGRRRNPVTAAAPRRHHRRRHSRHNRRRHARRNPGFGGLGNWVTAGAWAIAGAIGSKMLTQAVLGTGNVGWIGYGGNLAAAFVLGKGVGMAMKNKQAENAIILGGVIQTLLRFAIDKTPFGARLSTLGVGDYQASTFLSPARYLDPLRSAAVDIPTALRPLPAAAPAMSGLGAGSYARSASSY